MPVLWEAESPSNDGNHEECVQIEDIDRQLPEDAVFEGELHYAIHQALSELEPTEATVLKMLYGVGMLADHSPQEIAGYLQLTERRVMEIEKQALCKLQSDSFSSRLRSIANKYI